jgi:hypothetical protein
VARVRAVAGDAELGRLRVAGHQSLDPLFEQYWQKERIDMCRPS